MKLLYSSLVLLSIGCDSLRPPISDCTINIRNGLKFSATLLTVRTGSVIVDSTMRRHSADSSFSTAFSIPFNEISSISFERGGSGVSALGYGLTGCAAGFGLGCGMQAEEEGVIISPAAIKVGLIAGGLGLAAGIIAWGIDNLSHRVETYDPDIYKDYLQLDSYALYPHVEPAALQLVH